MMPLNTQRYNVDAAFFNLLSYLTFWLKAADRGADNFFVIGPKKAEELLLNTADIGVLYDMQHINFVHMF